MANPQKEKGYTVIANEIIEALARIRISGEEMKCLWVIFRKTYGWNKKRDCIALSQFVLMTGLKKQAAHRALKKLKEKNLITVNKKDDRQSITYGFNKDYSKWKPSTKKMTVNNIDKTVINNDDKPSTKMMNTKERKKLTKEIYLTLFDLFWKEYPLKVEKKKARDIWLKKIKPNNELSKKIMSGLKRAKQSNDWQKNNGEFIPHPTTWLNGERWADEMKGANETKQRYF